MNIVVDGRWGGGQPNARLVRAYTKYKHWITVVYTHCICHPPTYPPTPPGSQHNSNFNCPCPLCFCICHRRYRLSYIGVYNLSRLCVLCPLARPLMLTPERSILPFPLALSSFQSKLPVTADRSQVYTIR